LGFHPSFPIQFHLFKTLRKPSTSNETALAERFQILNHSIHRSKPFKSVRQKQQKQARRLLFRFHLAAIPSTRVQTFPTIKISAPKPLSAHAAIPQLAPGTHQGCPAARQRR